MSGKKSEELSETAIRPPLLVEEQMKLLAEDIAMLGTFKKKFVEVPCPACGENFFESRFEKNHIGFVFCKNCGTLYGSPRPSPEVLKHYYENSKNYDFWNEKIFPASEAVRREKIFKPRVERLLSAAKRFKISLKSVVEIGTGFGIFGEELVKQDKSIQFVGIEPTPGLAETCRKKGLEIIEKPVELIDQPLKADAICAFEVIEHLFSPLDFLVKCRDWLKPGAILFLTCPNYEGLDVRFLQAHSGSIENEHLNLFTTSSVRQLLVRAGYDPVEITTPGHLDFDIVKNTSRAQNLPVPKMIETILKSGDPHMAKDFQDFISQMGWSSNMQIVARRRSGT